MSLRNINSYTYSPGFNQGQYHNAVLCISGNVQSLYLNGVLVGSTTTAANILSYYPTINQILLGCAGDKSNGFTGYLDDFRMYNYAFNSSQVSNLYSNRNLIAYYPFDTILNNVANNIITTANNATLAYDATLIGNAGISNSTFKVGTGSLNLTNTAGTASTNYVNSSCKFSTSVTNQLSISLWFKTDGISGRTMRLFDLCPTPGTQGIYIDISGTNELNTLSNSYIVPVPTKNTNLIAKYLFTSVNTSNQTPNTASETPVYDFSVPVNSITTTPGSYPSFIGTTSLQISNNKSYLMNIPNATASYTVGVWFYMTSYSTYNAVLCCGTTDGFGSGTIFAYSDRGSRIEMWSPGAGLFAIIQSEITMNTWGFLSWSVTPSGTNSSVSILLQYYGAASPTYSNTLNVTGLYTPPNYFRLGQQMISVNAAYTSSGSYSNFQYYNTAYTLAQMTNLFNKNSI